jgi:hypothetical protein
MIIKLIQESHLEKGERKYFIPFVNERDYMGNIIKNGRSRSNGKTLFGTSSDSNLKMF